MSSLFLGSISEENRTYEVHVFTKNQPFREYHVSQIADEGLYAELLEKRFVLLELGKPIYCTAVKPDIAHRKEENPHDSREGTIHFVAVDPDIGIVAGLSVALDIGTMDKGSPVGLPLENKWQQNGFPDGESLDSFRKWFLRRNHNQDTDVKPWQMAELYRHFKLPTRKYSLIPRFAVYKGAVDFLVSAPLRAGREASWIWVFDAIPDYFHLYKLVGAAALRDGTIAEKPRWLSPGLKAMRQNHRDVHFGGEVISRPIEVPFPLRREGKLAFERRPVPFIDGVVDVLRLRSSVFSSPHTLRHMHIRGFTLADRFRLRLGMSVPCESLFDDATGKPLSGRLLDSLIHRKFRTSNNFGEK